MLHLFSLLQLLQVFSQSLGGPIQSSHLQYEAPRDGRQSSLEPWTVSKFSECSVTCGGGLRVRSIRCLSKNGIIAEDCSAETRPASYEFCNQIDCSTNTSEPRLIPASGTYSFNVTDSVSATLRFEVHGGAESYSVLLVVKEEDATTTTISQRVAPDGIQTRITIAGANDVISIREINGTLFFLVNGGGVLSLANAEVDVIPDSQSILYLDMKVSVLNGETVAAGISTFIYYDGFRFYTFVEDMDTEPLDGPGVLYHIPTKQVAFYSTEVNLNAELNQAILSAEADTNPKTTMAPPPNSTPDFSTPENSTPDHPENPTPSNHTTTNLVTTVAGHKTTAPPPSTNLPLTTTEEELKCDSDDNDEDNEEETDTQRGHRRHSTRSGKSQSSDNTKCVTRNTKEYSTRSPRDKEDSTRSTRDEEDNTSRSTRDEEDNTSRSTRDEEDNTSRSTRDEEDNTSRSTRDEEDNTSRSTRDEEDNTRGRGTKDKENSTRGRGKEDSTRGQGTKDKEHSIRGQGKKGSRGRSTIDKEHSTRGQGKEDSTRGQGKEDSRSRGTKDEEDSTRGQGTEDSRSRGTKDEKTTQSVATDAK